jgi:ATP-binding cassette subfamily B protein
MRPDDPSEDRTGETEARQPVTIYDVSKPAEARSLRALPGLIADSLRLVWQAGRREFLLSTGLQLLGGLGAIVVVLVGRDALDAFLTAEQAGTGFGDFLPSALVLAAVLAGLGFASAVQREQQQLLGELTQRHVLARMLDVTTAVELSAFERHGFHDRLMRAQATGRMGPFNLVFGLTSVVGAFAGAVGAIVALLALEPVLVPLAVLVFVPAWLVTSRRAEAYYSFAWTLTPRDRQREYISGLLTHKDPAKEVRAFNLARFLRARHDRLYDERIRELRGVVRRQLGYSLLANLGIFVIVGGTLGALVALALNGELGVAGAAAAAAAIVLLGQRLVMAGYGAGSLYEAALFVEDYRSFLTLGPEVERTRPSAPAPAGFSTLVAEDVTFTYPSGTAPAISGVSLRIEADEVVALVGENGSGKTTLAKLLCGLYVPDAGRILWARSTSPRATRTTCAAPSR